jgi:hypothetical protein
MYIWGIVFFANLIVQILIFKISKDLNFKKKFFPVSIIITGLIFLILPIYQFYPSIIVFPIVAGAAVIVFLNIKLHKFCDRCQKFRYNYTFYEAMKFCLICGEKFK